MNQYKKGHNQNVEVLSDPYREGLVQRITKNLLDVQILRLVRMRPMWGYMIKKYAETKFDVKLRHGALYPLLNNLEKESFLTSEKQLKGGRKRKVYMITQKGRHYLESYERIMKEQLIRKDIE
jgi:DNA-binding PadR family transcriptional regulator